MNKKILIIEDERDLNDLYKTKFVHEGYEVIQAFDGEEGLEKTKDQNNPPDLVLLDIMLPKIDGLNFLKKVKEDSETKSIPIVVLTALTDEMFAVQAVKNGASSYIVKSKAVPSDVVTEVKKFLS